MTDKVENMILNQLRAIRASQDRTEGEIKEIKNRLTSIENGIIAIRRDNTGTQEDVYHQQSAMDRINDRIDRIEKRLEIKDD